MLKDEECEYRRPGDGKPLPAVVVLPRAANKYDLRVEGFKLEPHQRATHQYVDFGTNPGQCCPVGWEPTQPYASPSPTLEPTPMTTAAKRWRAPTWPMWLALGLSVGNSTYWIWSFLGGP